MWGYSYTSELSIFHECSRVGVYLPSNETASHQIQLLEALKKGPSRCRLIVMDVGVEDIGGKKLRSMLQAHGGHLKRETISVVLRFPPEINPNISAKMAVGKIDKVIKDTGLGYIDVVLVPWPVLSQGSREQSSREQQEGDEEKFCSTWMAMGALVTKGHVKALGVDNFQPWQIDRLFAYISAYNAMHNHSIKDGRNVGHGNEEHGSVSPDDKDNEEGGSQLKQQQQQIQQGAGGDDATESQQQLERRTTHVNQHPICSPRVNFISASPLRPQQEIRDYCHVRHVDVAVCIEVEALLQQGSSSRAVIDKLAQERSMSAAQILSKWAMNKGLVPVWPHSTLHDLIQAEAGDNTSTVEGGGKTETGLVTLLDGIFALLHPLAGRKSTFYSPNVSFDFALSKEDMKALDALEVITEETKGQDIGQGDGKEPVASSAQQETEGGA